MTTESEAHVIANYIKDYWPVILSALGFVVSIMVLLKGKIPSLEEKVKELRDRLNRLDGDYLNRNSVYDSNNQVRFQTVPACAQVREECRMQQKTFQNNICKTIDKLSDDIKLIIHDADYKRESTRNEITDMNKKLIELMTQMKNLIDKDRTKEMNYIIESTVRQVIQFNSNNKLIGNGK
jgi:hypothetical protein